MNTRINSFDRVNHSQSPRNMAEWIVFLRLYCLIRGPACVYSKIATPMSHRIYRNIYIIPLPDQVSNLLCNLIEERDARELAVKEALCITEKDKDSDLKQELKSLCNDFGIITEKLSIDSTFKPRGCRPYGISKSTVVTFGEVLGATLWRHMDVRKDIASALSRVDMSLEPAPLWPDEVEWLKTKCGWYWDGPVIYEEVV